MAASRPITSGEPKYLIYKSIKKKPAVLPKNMEIEGDRMD